MLFCLIFISVLRLDDCEKFGIERWSFKLTKSGGQLANDVSLVEVGFSKLIILHAFVYGNLTVH